MGTGLKEASLPLIKINFPISKSIEDALKSIKVLFEFYGIPSSEAEEIKEKILKLIRDYESKGKEERFDLDIIPQKERVEILLSIKEDLIRKNILISFKSKKIKILQIRRKGKRINIKIGVFKNLAEFKQE